MNRTLHQIRFAGAKTALTAPAQARFAPFAPAWGSGTAAALVENRLFKLTTLELNFENYERAQYINSFHRKHAGPTGLRLQARRLHGGAGPRSSRATQTSDCPQNLPAPAAQAALSPGGLREPAPAGGTGAGFLSGLMSAGALAPADDSPSRVRVSCPPTSVPPSS
jgi:hypothetical protein